MKITVEEYSSRCPLEDVTLADLEPYEVGLEESGAYFSWRDTENNVLTFNPNHGKIFLDEADPEDIKIIHRYPQATLSVQLNGFIPNV